VRGFHGGWWLAGISLPPSVKRITDFSSLIWNCCNLDVDMKKGMTNIVSFFIGLSEIVFEPNIRLHEMMKFSECEFREHFSIPGLGEQISGFPLILGKHSIDAD
jgi:hypothetical protein